LLIRWQVPQSSELNFNTVSMAMAKKDAAMAGIVGNESAARARLQAVLSVSNPLVVQQVGAQLP